MRLLCNLENPQPSGELCKGDYLVEIKRCLGRIVYLQVEFHLQVKFFLVRKCLCEVCAWLLQAGNQQCLPVVSPVLKSLLSLLCSDSPEGG